MLRIAIPNKGRLSEPSLDIMKKSGISIADAGERSLFAATNNPDVQVLFVRADDIPKYVEMGAADAGITGFDLVQDRSADVKILARLNFGKCRLSLAVPSDSRIRGAKDLEGKKVATKYVGAARKFLQKNGVKCDIVEVAGAAEITPFLGVSDAIIDLVSTGTTLAVNKLKEVEVIVESTACFIANKKSAEEKGKKEILEELALSFEGIKSAEGKKYVMVNVPSQAVLSRVVGIIPGMESPTVLKLAKEGEYAVHAVVEEKRIPSTVRMLKTAGAKDILILNVDRAVP